MELANWCTPFPNEPVVWSLLTKLIYSDLSKALALKLACLLKVVGAFGYKSGSNVGDIAARYALIIFRLNNVATHKLHDRN